MNKLQVGAHLEADVKFRVDEVFFTLEQSVAGEGTLPIDTVVSPFLEPTAGHPSQANGVGQTAAVTPTLDPIEHVSAAVRSVEVGTKRGLKEHLV